MKISYLLKLIALSSSLALAACGGGGSDSSGGTGGTSGNSGGNGGNSGGGSGGSDGDTGGDSGGDTGGDTGGSDGDTGEETAGAITFNLSGAVTVVTTKETATEVDDSGAVGAPQAMSKTLASDGRSLKTFVFHKSNDSKKLTRQDKFQSFLKAGFSKSSATSNANSSSSNLFIMDESGNLKFAAESEYDMKISYSVFWDERILVAGDSEDALSTDEYETKQWLFFALDSNEPWLNANLIHAAGNCAIFKVDVETSESFCVEPNHFAVAIDDSYRKTQSDQNKKPIQIDENGNALYIARPFTVITEDFNGDGEQEYSNLELDYDQKRLRKVNAEGEGRYLTPDNFTVNTFMAMPNDTVAYTYYESQACCNSNLNLVKGISEANPETYELETGFYSEDFFYIQDDLNTIIYSNGEHWESNGVNFVQPIIGGRGRHILELSTKDFSDNDYNSKPKRIILSDDGSIYGLFLEERYNDVTQTNTFKAKLKRMLPFSSATYAEIYVGNSWEDYWNFFQNGQRDVQVSKGYVYYIEDLENPTLGKRTVVRAIRLVDGKQVNLLEDEDWNQRYDIYNWKLSGDDLFFTGFDKNKSLSISGRIDTLALKQGKEESEFLEITETASVLGDSNRIDDLVVLRGEQSNVFTGNSPKVSRYFTNQDNLRSASVEFSKYMNNQEVSDGTNIYQVIEDDNGEESKVAVPLTLKVWLNRTMHLVFDTDLESIDPNTGSVNVTTEPLPTSTNMLIELDPEAHDVEGFDLLSGESILSTEWVTRPTEGWYVGETTVIDGITDGQIGKYAAPRDSNGTTDVDLVTLGYPLNVKVAYSMSSAPSGRNTLSLQDSHSPDYSNIDSVPVDENQNAWVWSNSMLVSYDKSSVAIEHWIEDAEWKSAYRDTKQTVTVKPILSSIVDGNDNVVEGYFVDPETSNHETYTYIPYHLVDTEGSLYVEYWTQSESGNVRKLKYIGTDKLNPIASGVIYNREPEYYQNRDTLVKYTYRSSGGVYDWYDAEDNIIDWNETLDYYSEVWVDESGNQLSSGLDYSYGYWVNEEGQFVEYDRQNMLWQNGFYASDINNDGYINLDGLCQFDGPKNDTEGCLNTSFASAEAGEEYAFNGDWSWENTFTVDDFVASSDEHRTFFKFLNGGWFNSYDGLSIYTQSPERLDWFDIYANEVTNLQSGWSQGEWVRYEFTIVTDTSGEADVTTAKLEMINGAGEVVFENTQTIALDVKSASWPIFKDVPEYQDKGFKLNLKVSDGTASIDNIVVTNLTTNEVLVEEKFELNENIFNSSVALEAEVQE